MYFFENYTKSEALVKEIENQLSLIRNEKFKALSYTKINYINENNLFVDNMFFLVGKEDDEEKKINEFINLFEGKDKEKNNDKEKEKNYKFGSLFVFYDDYDNNIIDSLMKIIEKCFKH